jgi:hypothetical protein
MARRYGRSNVEALRREEMVSKSFASLPQEPGKGLNKYGSQISILALLIRIVPLITSIFLFILVASADINRWSGRTLQLLLVIAILLGIVGIVLFIPKRVIVKSQ